MTIAISPGIASQFAAAGTENNPILLWLNRTRDGAWTQFQGTEIETPNFLTTPSTYDRWIAELNLASGNAAAEVILPSARAFNCICIAAHTIGGIGATVRPQFSTDGGSTWDTTTAGDIDPTTNEAMCWLFDDAPTTVNWRIRILGGTPQARISMGVAFFGNFLQIPQRIYQGYTPPITPTIVDLQTNVSETGNLLGSSIFRKGSTTVANLTHLLPSFIRDPSFLRWAAFQSHFNEQGGAFWMWRPTQFGDAFYGWRDGATLLPTNSGPKSYMAASLEMRLFDAP